MSLKTYFIENFLVDAERLQYEPVNHLLLSGRRKRLVDANTYFFGGKDWKNCHKDLLFVEQKAAFVSCAFAAICTDLNMKMTYPDEYRPWRSGVYIPCFGWQEFRPCFESPEKLLSVPVQLGLIRMEDLDAEELAQTWFERLKKYFEIFIIYVEYPDFLQTTFRKTIFKEEHPVLGDFLIRLRMEMERLATTL